MSKIEDELKAINRKLDAIKDRRIAENIDKFYKDLIERFPPPDFTRGRNRIEYYAGQFKNPFMGDVLAHNEAKNRLVVMLIASILCLIIIFISGFHPIVIFLSIICFIFTLFEFYFYSKTSKDDSHKEQKINVLDAYPALSPWLKLHPEIKESLIDLAVSGLLLALPLLVLIFASHGADGIGIAWFIFISILFFIYFLYYFIKSCFRFLKIFIFNK